MFTVRVKLPMDVSYETLLQQYSGGVQLWNGGEYCPQAAYGILQWFGELSQCSYWKFGVVQTERD